MAFLFLDKAYAAFKRRAQDAEIFTKDLELTYKVAKSGDAEAQFDVSEVCHTLDLDEDALSWLSLSAEQGYYPAEYTLGKTIYEKGSVIIEGQEGYSLSYDDPVFWLERAADHGSPDAAALLARTALEKEPPDEDAAAKWYKLSYKLGGECDFAFTAAYCIAHGERDLALEMCRISAGSGDLDSALTAGRLLIENGEYATAEEYLQILSMASESVEALYLLGICREYQHDPEGALSNYKKAFSLLIQGKATAAGAITDALFEKLGDVYYYGNGVEANAEKAVYYYSKVKNFSSHDSKLNFAGCKFNGNGSDRDVESAAQLGLPDAMYELYLRDNSKTSMLASAAALGYAPAKYTLGKLHYSDGEYDRAILELLPVSAAYDDVSFILGVCFTRAGNYPEARAYFELAAEKGNSEAEYLVGRFYMSGLGTPADPVKAVEWFKRSAAKGDPTGAYELGMCCKNGTGTAKNPARGMSLITAAAENGCAPAMFELANCLRLGSGVGQNREQALGYYGRSAELGYEPAMYQLAFLYELGYVTGERDPQNALEWYRKCRKKYKDVAARISTCILEINGSK